MSNPFIYVDSVSRTKEDLMRGNDLAEKEYLPFITNRALSYHHDAILYANEMNRCWNIDNRLQYDYYLYSLRKNKRMSKWAKPEKTLELTAIMDYYGYSRVKALEAMKILTNDQITEIISKMQLGGVTK